jgi:hypothetical protein
MKNSKIQEKQPLLDSFKKNKSTCYLSVTSRISDKAHSNIPREAGGSAKLRILIVGCLSTGFACGFQMATSFLIHPVSSTCSQWSSSATVYGASSLAVGWGLSGPPNVLLRKAGLRLFCFLSLLACTSSFLVAGTSVFFCMKDASGISQWTYIGSFCMFGFGASLALTTMGAMLVNWLPLRPGIAGGLFGMGISLGSIGFTLTELQLSKLFDQGKLEASTIFFLLGFIVFFLMVPWIPMVSYPSGENHLLEDYSVISNASQTKLERLKELLKDRQVLIMSFTFFVHMATGMAVLSSLSKILTHIWGNDDSPLVVLSTIALSCYVLGRLFWLAIGDTIGLKKVWYLSMLLQALFLAIVPWFIEASYQWTRYVAMVFISSYMFVYPAVKASQVGLTYMSVGSKNGDAACGVLNVVSGIAGLAGPFTFEQSLLAFGTYTPFFICSAVLALFAGVLTGTFISTKTSSIG